MPINETIRNILKSIQKYIKFIWTPSHVGITDNEMADKAYPTFIYLPNNDIKSSIK